MSDKFSSLLSGMQGEPNEPAAQSEENNQQPQGQEPADAPQTNDNQGIAEFISSLGYENTDAFKSDFEKLSRFKDVADDEYIGSAIDYYRQSGDLSQFVTAKGIDWEQMPAEEVMRHELRKQYPELSDKAFEKVYAREVVQKYGIDPDEYDEDEIAVNRELLEVDAKKIRATEMEAQKKFGNPQPNKQQKEVEEMVSRWHSMVDSDPVFTSLSESKKLEIKHGEQSFNYEVTNPSAAAEMAKDEQKFFQTLWKDGKFDSRNWAMIVEFAQDPNKFVRTLMNWGETIGVAKAESAIAGAGEPASPGNPVSPGPTGNSLLDAFRAKGKHS